MDSRLLRELLGRRVSFLTSELRPEHFVLQRFDLIFWERNRTDELRFAFADHRAALASELLPRQIGLEHTAHPVRNRRAPWLLLDIAQANDVLSFDREIVTVARYATHAPNSIVQPDAPLVRVTGKPHLQETFGRSILVTFLDDPIDETELLETHLVAWHALRESASLADDFRECDDRIAFSLPMDFLQT